MSKPWWKSKVIWIAIIQAAVGLLVIFSGKYPEIGTFLTLKSLLDVMLRFLTEVPIGDANTSVDNPPAD